MSAFAVIYTDSLTHSSVAWIYDTFDNNSGIKDHFTKYLKESFWLCLH